MIDRPTAHPRGARLHPRSQVDAWCAAAVGSAAGLGYAAAFLALLHTVGGGRLGTWALAALALMAIPFVEPVFARDGTLDPRARRVFEGASIGLRLVLVVFLCAASPRPEYAVPALLLLLQSIFLARISHDALAVFAIATALLQAGLAAVAARGATSLALLALQLVATIVAGVLLHARATRRRVVHATVRREQVPDETPAGMWRRLVFCVGLAMFVAVLAIAIDGAVQSARPATRSTAGPVTGPAEEAPEPSDEVASAPGGMGSRFPDDIDLSPSLDPLGSGRILEVVLRGPDGADLGDRGQVLLEGMHLDQFTATGLDLRLDDDPVLLRDADDGVDDGWIQLPREREPAGEAFTAEITQGVLEIGPAGEAPLFRPEPALAVALEEALFDPHGWLTTTGPEGLLRYEVRSAFRTLGLDDLAGIPARHAEARYVELPPESDDLAFVRARAAEVCAGAGDDAARVDAVVEHFRTGYRYSFEASGFSGVAGLRDFLERREGFCTWFASAAVLLLRLEGVPARIATGYRCREWSPQEARYVVRERDGHAWIEVHFDGVGWAPFDPTPNAAIERALDEMFGTEREQGLSAWYEDLRAALAAWTDPDDETGSLRAVVLALYQLPAALWASVRGNPLAALALSLAAVLATAWALRRRLARALERVGLRPPGADRSTFYWHRLLRALARRGHVKRPGQTPREFARTAISRAGAEFAPLDRVVDLLYRDRYAGVPLDVDERRFVEGVVAGLAGGQDDRTG